MGGNSSVSPESRIPLSCAVAAAILLIKVVSRDDGACGVGRQACRGRARLSDCRRVVPRRTSNRGREGREWVQVIRRAGQKGWL
eukprot:3420566-Rhodomonas_salina.1